MTFRNRERETFSDTLIAEMGRTEFFRRILRIASHVLS